MVAKGSLNASDEGKRWGSAGSVHSGSDLPGGGGVEVKTKIYKSSVLESWMECKITGPSSISITWMMSIMRGSVIYIVLSLNTCQPRPL